MRGHRTVIFWRRWDRKCGNDSVLKTYVALPGCSYLPTRKRIEKVACPLWGDIEVFSGKVSSLGDMPLNSPTCCSRKNNFTFKNTVWTAEQHKKSANTSSEQSQRYALRSRYSADYAHFKRVWAAQLSQPPNQDRHIFSAHHQCKAHYIY